MAAPLHGLARHELDVSRTPAARLAVVLREAALVMGDAAVLVARRPAPPPPAASATALTGPPPPVAVRGWASAGADGVRDLRAWGRAAAGDAAVAIACRHLCPWLGAPTAGDVALLAQLGAAPPASFCAVPAALGPRRTLLVVGYGDLAPTPPSWQGLVGLVQHCALQLHRGRGTGEPSAPTWPLLAAAAETAAAWASGSG